MALKATMVQTQNVKVYKMFDIFIINLLNSKLLLCCPKCGKLQGEGNCVSNCINIVYITQKYNNYVLMQNLKLGIIVKYKVFSLCPKTIVVCRVQ